MHLRIEAGAQLGMDDDLRLRIGGLHQDGVADDTHIGHHPYKMHFRGLILLEKAPVESTEAGLGHQIYMGIAGVSVMIQTAVKAPPSLPMRQWGWEGAVLLWYPGNPAHGYPM